MNPFRIATGALARLKARLEEFAKRPSAEWSLFGVAFVESSFFPIPPDALLIPMGINRPGKSLRYALICTAGSVLGAFLGYFIGYAMFETVGRPLLEFYGVLGSFHEVLARYRENGIVALFVAGFTPIPFKLFTIAAGFDRTLDLTTLAIGSIIGRSSRFFLVGALLRFYGEPVKVFLDRWFDRLSLAFVALLVLGFIGIRLLT